MMVEMTIYTSCFGGYDELRTFADVRYDEVYNPYGGCLDQFSDRMKAKMYKVLNPDSLDIWIDSSVDVLDRGGFENLFKGDLCVFKHPFHKSVAEELDVCNKLGYVNDSEVGKIKELYLKESLDMENTPVYSCGILFRTSKTREFNRDWWSLISQYSYRDQLTFPLAVKKHSYLEFNVVDMDVYDNKYTKVGKHR